jgi:hypothetical protein
MTGRMLLPKFGYLYRQVKYKPAVDSKPAKGKVDGKLMNVKKCARDMTIATSTVTYCRQFLTVATSMVTYCRHSLAIATSMIKNVHDI